MPDVSIIMPNYNCAGFIAESIESVQAQTLKSWELIICDDHSTDSSVDIIKRYSDNDPRIRLIINEKPNSGSAFCRNVALAAATGDYIAFLDSDDLWDTQKLDKQISFMRAHNIEISYTSYNIIRENGEKIHTIIPPKSVDYIDSLKGKWMHTSTIMVKRSIPIEFPSLRVGQDIALWLKLFSTNKYKGYGLLQPLTHYRLRRSSASSNKLKTVLLHWKRIRSQEKVSLPFALYYFCCYAFSMLKKYISILPDYLRIQ